MWCNSIKEILTLSWSKIWSVYLCLIFLRLFFRYDLFTFFLNLVCSKCVVSSFLQLLFVKGSCPIIYYIVPSLRSFTFFYNTYLFIKYMIFCKKLFILISLHTALVAFIFVQKPETRLCFRSIIFWLHLFCPVICILILFYYTLNLDHLNYLRNWWFCPTIFFLGFPVVDFTILSMK